MYLPIRSINPSAEIWASSENVGYRIFSLIHFATCGYKYYQLQTKLRVPVYVCFNEVYITYR